ncbi:hypothetical protein ASD00_36525 [Ensifer sp. Root31]|uniref:hypothetical protein n=1 Tax=Ensifer sp. Root31 TaxID=1736512 RepID=UPI0007104E07|nr:hypothetical protein [Ensifer sp. Root31]KQU79353.1 hypothetical protein ASD00_36525 [Ensifer sp. Root31]
MRHNLLGFAALAATVLLALSTAVPERSFNLAGALVGIAHAQEGEGTVAPGLGNGTQGLGGSTGTSDPIQQGPKADVKPDTAVDRTRLGNGETGKNDAGAGPEADADAKPALKAEEPGAQKDGAVLERSLAVAAATSTPVESPVSALSKPSVPEITGNGSMTQAIAIDVPRSAVSSRS